MVEGETLLVLLLVGHCQHPATVLQSASKGAVSVHWYNVRAFGDHGNLHCRFLSVPAPPETGDNGVNPGAEKQQLGARGLEPWIGLAFAQVPLFAVAQIWDPILIALEIRAAVPV